MTAHSIPPRRRTPSDATALWGSWVDEEPVDELERAAEEARLTARLTRHDVTAVLVAHDGARWLPFCTRRPRRPGAAAPTRRRRRHRLAPTPRRASSPSPSARRASCPAARDRFRCGRGARGRPRSPGRPACRRRRADGPVVEWCGCSTTTARPSPTPCAPCSSRPSAPRRRASSARRSAAGRTAGCCSRSASPSAAAAGARPTSSAARPTRASTTSGVDVLAVGSAGMLVRRDAWDALGGFDRGPPAVPRRRRLRLARPRAPATGSSSPPTRSSTTRRAWPMADASRTPQVVPSTAPTAARPCSCSSATSRRAPCSGPT